MNSSYEWLSFGKDNNTRRQISSLSSPVYNFMDIMGAPISQNEEFQLNVDTLMNCNTTLCISGELKKYGEGQPASNYRYNSDDLLNENVIRNYFYLFKKYDELNLRKPIIVTTIPLLWRKYSWFIRKNGTILQIDQDYHRECSDPDGRFEWTGLPDEVDLHDKEANSLMKFLEVCGVTPSAIGKLGESCEKSEVLGHAPRTYLIDMISFLYQRKINSNEFHSLFSLEYRSPTSITGAEMTWPVFQTDEKMNYLFFEETRDNDGYIFFVPKSESVNLIYQEFDKAIDPYENEVKKRIREHLCKYHIDRWTDFDANDTDDAFTILMLIHAFSCNNTLEEIPLLLSEEEEIIKKNLEELMKPWFHRLHCLR